MSEPAEALSNNDAGGVAALWAHHRRWLKPLLLLVLSLVIARIIINFVGAIDWAAVRAAFGRLSAWQIIPLLLALLARQSFNAIPLSRFVPGLGWGRSIQNDLTANLVGTLSPPPSDVVLRIAMFKSWNIDPVDGMAGVTLNMITFYIVRFIAPALGLVVLAFEEAQSQHIAAAITSAAIAVGIMVALYLIMHGDALASLLGRSAGRVATRVRSSVDPEKWADSVVAFRGRMSQTLRAGLAISLISLVVMVFCDSLVLLLALRFVGVDSTALTAVAIIGAFLLAYPLTLMPLAGLGILDAALLAGWTEIAGLEWEAEIVAGLVVWRVITILGPLALGGLTLFIWRRHHGSTAKAAVSH